MKRLMISLLGALAFSAAAQTAPQTSPATEAPTVAKTDAKKVEPDDAYCLRQSGTRITARATTGKTHVCNIGRSYTRDDLQRTGQINIADAMRTLDPSIH